MAGENAIALAIHEIVTNRDILRITDDIVHPLPLQVQSGGHTIAWMASSRAQPMTRYVAVFNVGGKQLAPSTLPQSLNFDDDGILPGVGKLPACLPAQFRTTRVCTTHGESLLAWLSAVHSLVARPAGAIHASRLCAPLGALSAMVGSSCAICLTLSASRSRSLGAHLVVRLLHRRHRGHHLQASLSDSAH